MNRFLKLSPWKQKELSIKEMKRQ